MKIDPLARRSALILAFVLNALSVLAQTFTDADWVSLNPVCLPGANNSIYAVAVDDSGNVYVGGTFTAIGAITANHIAKWDGTSWSALSSGVNDMVNALAVSGNDLYVGGSFTTAGGITASKIAKWDGAAWSPLGGGVDGAVDTLAASGASLYVGGRFTYAGGELVNRIAKWDGSSWSALGAGTDSSAGTVYAIAIDDNGIVYAGGSFTAPYGTVFANNIAKWDGSAWSPLVNTWGQIPEVHALAVSGTNLYMGGSFKGAGGVTVTNIAKWDGTTWSALGFGVNGEVDELAVIGTNLYAGGIYTLARWDGSIWTPLPPGPGIVTALAMHETNLYAGGMTGGLAKWDGYSWASLGEVRQPVMQGINSPYSSPGVQALAVSGTNLCLGGSFSLTTTSSSNIAKWDGLGFSGIGGGMNGPVYALAVMGTNLYAGGYFSSPARCIAKWDGNTWSALGSGLIGNVVKAIAVSGTNLYVGGPAEAGGVWVNGIAKWDGTTWSALGSGIGYSGARNPHVACLAVSGTNLFIGGLFDRVNGISATNIAKWDGFAWSALGTGVAGYDVYALAVSGTNLYAGGRFGSAGGLPATNVAKWDGTTWSPLGSGMNNLVYALAVVGTNLYAGGGFSIAGGVSANAIAKWDGTSWSALGSGVEDGGLSALAFDSGRLFVGGSFSTAGTNLSPYLAQANVGLGLNPGRFETPSWSPLTGFTCTFRDASPGVPYRIQAASSPNTWTDLTNFTYTAPLTLTAPPSNATTTLYRAASP